MLQKLYILKHIRDVKNELVIYNQEECVCFKSMKFENQCLTRIKSAIDQFCHMTSDITLKLALF